VCYGAEKCQRQWPAETLSDLRVCCERALKGAGERNTHGGVGAGAFGKPLARGAFGVSTSCTQRLFAPPCWQIADRVVGRAASLFAALTTSQRLAASGP
jgi:hypothetical protein